MTLARSAFVTLAFTAKNHNLLTHGQAVHPETQKLMKRKSHIAQSLDTILQKITEKEHGHVTSEQDGELQSLKKLALQLRQEFDMMKQPSEARASR